MESWRGWYNNEDYYLPFAEWVAYMATGNRALWDSVTCFSRHLMDVDTLNYTTRKNPGILGCNPATSACTGASRESSRIRISTSR